VFFPVLSIIAHGYNIHANRFSTAVPGRGGFFSPPNQPNAATVLNRELRINPPANKTNALP